MDTHQRQRLAIALEKKGITMRRASLAARDPSSGKPLLGSTYVREVIARGRGTKESVELICAANGISFDFVWNNLGGIEDHGAASSAEYLKVSKAALTAVLEEAFLWLGARADQAHMMAELSLAKILERSALGQADRSGSSMAPGTGQTSAKS